MRKLSEKSGSAAALSPVKRALLEKRLRGEGYKAPAIARQRADRAPLSFAQRRLWFLCSLRSDDPAYNIPVMVRLCGRLDIAALERAINELVRRHEILRTGFLVVDGEPIQRIEPELEIELPLEDLSGRPGTERESCYRSRTLAELRQPFDLERAPLLRARLFRLNADDARTEHVLSLVFHHIVFDGWSAGILCRELTQIYLAFAAGRMHALPEPPIQYSDLGDGCWSGLEGNPWNGSSPTG